jgi:hypothetical protein
MVAVMKLACLFVLVAGAALADPKPAKPQQPSDAPAIANTYGFDWLKIKSSKCTKVSGALLKKLTASYRCSPPPAGIGTASGKVQVAVCTATKGKSEVLLFSTAGDCKAERDTQLANGTD